MLGYYFFKSCPFNTGFMTQNFEAKNLIVNVSTVSNYRLVVVNINQQLLPACIASPANSDYCPLPVTFINTLTFCLGTHWSTGMIHRII